MLVDEASEAIVAHQLAARNRPRLGGRAGQLLLKPLMQSSAMVMLEERRQYPLQMSSAEDPSVHHPVRDDDKPPPYSGDGGPGEGVAQVVDLWITEPSLAFPEILATRGALPYGGQAPGADSLKIPTLSRCPSPEVSPPVLTSRTGLT